MKCVNCGFENAANAKFCAKCGSGLPEQANTAGEANGIVGPAQKALEMFKDNLFLVLCILLSVSTVLGFTVGSVNVIAILFTVFLWLIFAKARSNRVEVSNMRCVSGTVFAQFVMGWVAVGFLALSAVIFLIIGAAASATDTSELMSEIMSEAQIYGSAAVMDFMAELAEISLSTVFIVLAVIMSAAIIIVILVNIFFTRPMHLFAKSFYQSVSFGRYCIVKLKAAKVAMLVLAVLGALSALGSLPDAKAFLANASLAGTYLMGYLLINKHFKMD